MDSKQIAKDLTPIVNAYLMARCMAEIEREKVNRIEREILSTASYFTADEWNHRGMKRERITDPKNAWLMSDTESHDYLSDVRKALESAGYKIKGIPGEPFWSYYCPALCAETLQNDAERALIDLAGELLNSGDDFHTKLLCAGLDKRQKFIDLTVKFVVNSPGYQAPKLAA